MIVAWGIDLETAAGDGNQRLPQDIVELAVVPIVRNRNGQLTVNADGLKCWLVKPPCGKVATMAGRQVEITESSIRSALSFREVWTQVQRVTRAGGRHRTQLVAHGGKGAERNWLYRAAEQQGVDIGPYDLLDTLFPAQRLAKACWALVEGSHERARSTLGDAEWERVRRWAMHRPQGSKGQEGGEGCGLQALTSSVLSTSPPWPGPHRAGPDALMCASLWVEIEQMRKLLGMAGVEVKLGLDAEPMLSRKGWLAGRMHRVWFLSTRQVRNWGALERRDGKEAPSKEALLKLDDAVKRALGRGSRDLSSRNWSASIVAERQIGGSGAVYRAPDGCHCVCALGLDLDPGKFVHDFFVAELGLCLWEVGCEVIFERDARLHEGEVPVDENAPPGKAKQPDLVVRAEEWHLVELERTARNESRLAEKCRALLSRAALRKPSDTSTEAPWVDYLGVVWVMSGPRRENRKLNGAARVAIDDGNEFGVGRKTAGRSDNSAIRHDAIARGVWKAFGALALPENALDTLNLLWPIDEELGLYIGRGRDLGGALAGLLAERRSVRDTPVVTQDGCGCSGHVVEVLAIAGVLRRDLAAVHEVALGAAGVSEEALEGGHWLAYTRWEALRHGSTGRALTVRLKLVWVGESNGWWPGPGGKPNGDQRYLELMVSGRACSARSNDGVLTFELRARLPLLQGGVAKVEECRFVCVVGDANADVWAQGLVAAERSGSRVMVRGLLDRHSIEGIKNGAAPVLFLRSFRADVRCPGPGASLSLVTPRS